MARHAAHLTEGAAQIPSKRRPGAVDPPTPRGLSCASHCAQGRSSIVQAVESSQPIFPSVLSSATPSSSPPSPDAAQDRRAIRPGQCVGPAIREAARIVRARRSRPWSVCSGRLRLTSTARRGSRSPTSANQRTPSWTGRSPARNARARAAVAPGAAGGTAPDLHLRGLPGCRTRGARPGRPPRRGAPCPARNQQRRADRPQGNRRGRAETGGALHGQHASRETARRCGVGHDRFRFRRSARSGSGRTPGARGASPVGAGQPAALRLGLEQPGSHPERPVEDGLGRHLAMTSQGRSGPGGDDGARPAPCRRQRTARKQTPSARTHGR